MQILLLSATDSTAAAESLNLLEDVADMAAQGAGVAEDIEKLNPNYIVQSLQEALPLLLKLLYQIGIVLLILLVGSKLISYFMGLFGKFLEKSPMDRGLRKFTISLVRAAAYVLLLLIAAQRIGINSTSIVAVLGSAGLAIGLALQGSLSNFAGGVLILVMKPFITGDYIVTDLAEGKVHAIGLVYSTIITYDNKKITMPNGNLANSVITNLTARTERMLEIKVGVAYDSDVEKVKKILYELCSNDEGILKDKEILCYLDAFEPAAMMVGLRAWCSGAEYNKTKWRLNEKIKAAFDAQQIEMPHNAFQVLLKKDQG